MLPVLLAATVAGAATHPTVAPARTAAPPRIDGRLDDPVWRAATSFTGFVEKYPAEGHRPAEPTSLRVLYDDRALYLAIDCDQPGAPVVARLTRRDRVVEADRVVVYLDTQLDRKTAFHFEVNAAGVQADAIHFDDTDVSYAWDEVWQSAVTRRPHGWSVEMAIPLKLLRFRPGATQTWGLEVRRFVVATREEDELAYIPRDQGGEVSRFGQLGPLHHLERPLGLDLRPFATAQLSHRQPTPDLAARGTDLAATAGLDGRWRLSPSTTLDFTVNPDFGQVEADQVVLNLTNVESFLPEKRPFFLEGLDLFATPVQVLYTRRIGQVAPAPALAANQTLVSPPGPIRIDGAAKLTGRTGPLSYAALSAVSPATSTDVRDPDGTTRAIEVAPTTLYQAARLKLDLDPRAAVGVITTATSRLGAQRDAWVGGVDGIWRSAGGDWSASGQALVSAIHGGQARRFPDGSVIGPGDASGAAVASIEKQGGRAVGQLDCDVNGRHFDPDDLGYIDRQNQAHCFASVGWHDTRPGRWLEEAQHNLEVFYRANLRGQPLGSGIQLNTSARLASEWRYFTELHLRPAHVDDREVGDGTAVERAGLVGWELEVESDPRRRVAFQLGSTAQWLTDGINLELESTWTLHLHPQLDLEILPTALYTQGEPRYLEDDGDQRLFGRQRALALGATVRGTFTFTTQLSLGAYAQLFVDRVSYSQFSSAPATRSVIHLADLTPHAAPAAMTDGDRGTFNASLVLRWDVRPGSTAYVVATHAQGRAAETRGTGALPALTALGGAAADAILVKLSWLLG